MNTTIETEIAEIERAEGEAVAAALEAELTAELRDIETGRLNGWW